MLFKRISTLILCLCLLMTGINAYATGATFSLTPIKCDTDSKRISFKITIPEKIPDSTLYVAFYTDGVLSLLTPLNSSTALSFSKTVKYTLTPDDIKLMMWTKGSLKPLSSSDSVLTEEQLSTANSLVEDLLSKVEDTTDSMREMLFSNRTEDREIMCLLDAIDNCAKNAIKADYGKSHLLTSDFCKNKFSNELSHVQSLYNNSSSKAKERLENLYLNYLEDEYADVIRDFMGFFDIKIEL